MRKDKPAGKCIRKLELLEHTRQTIMPRRSVFRHFSVSVGPLSYLMGGLNPSARLDISAVPSELNGPEALALARNHHQL